MFVPLYLCDISELRKGEERCQVGRDYQEFIAHHWSGMLGLSRLPPWETALGCFDFSFYFHCYSVFFP